MNKICIKALQLWSVFLFKRVVILKRVVVYIVILAVFLSIIIGFVFFQTSSSREDAIVQGVNETVKSALIQTIDYSSRINEGEAFFNQSAFENIVQENLPENSGISNKSDINFTYLNDSNGNTKAVRVQVKADDKEYQTTMIANIEEGDD